MVHQLTRQDRLQAALLEAQERTLDEMESLMRQFRQQGLNPQQAHDQAWELVRERYILLPPEQGRQLRATRTTTGSPTPTGSAKAAEAEVSPEPRGDPHAPPDPGGGPAGDHGGKSRHRAICRLGRTAAGVRHAGGAPPWRAEQEELGRVA